MASAEAGGGASGPRNAMVASREGRSNSTEIVPYSTPSAERSRLSGVSTMPLPAAGRCDLPAKFAPGRSSLGPRPPPSAGRPVRGALPLDPLPRGAEHVGAIAAHLALVGDGGEPAGAGEHGKQRQLGQRDRRGTVVDQHDVIGCER